MNRISVKFFIIIINLLSFGCTTHYYNSNYPDNQQQKHFAIDNGYCTQVSYGSLPMQQVVINNNVGSTTTSGNVYLSGTKGNNYQGRYNSTTTYNGNFASGFADGMNIGSAIGASIDRSNIFNSCLTQLGWYRVKKPTNTNPSIMEPAKVLSSLDFGAGLGDNVILSQQSIDELTNNGFISPIYMSSSKSYYLLKGDSIRKEGPLYFVTIGQIHINDIMQTFPGTTKQGVPVAYKIYEYMIDTTAMRQKVIKMEVYNRNNEKIYTHLDSEMNSITNPFAKASIVDAYLNRYSQEYNNASITLDSSPVRISIADSYKYAISFLSGQGFIDPLFDKTSWAQYLIKKDSIVYKDNKLYFSLAQIYDVDRIVKTTESGSEVNYIAYYKHDYMADIKAKRFRTVGYKAYNRKNEEILSHVYSDMEVKTAEISKTSVLDKYLLKYSPDYAAKLN